MPPTHRMLTLAALDAAQGDALARALLQRMPVGAEPLHALLLARADGNPFYMEELVRMFLDDGVIATDADVDGERLAPRARAAARGTRADHARRRAAARLDALPAAAPPRAAAGQHRRLCVLGRRAGRARPGRAAAMPALQGKSQVQRRDGSAFEGTLEEAFHHHLLQQVTYDTVLKPARRAGHAAARSGWPTAWATARRVSAGHRRALRARRRSRQGHRLLRPRRVRRAGALREPDRARLRRPCAAQPGSGHRPADAPAHAVAARTHGRSAGQRALQEATLAELQPLATELADDKLLADIVIAQALLASRRGEETRAFELATQAAEIAVRAGNPNAAGLALGQMAWSLHTRGEAAAALDHALRALASVREARARKDTSEIQLLEVQTLTLLAIMQEAVCDLAAARAASVEVLGLARERGCGARRRRSC